jgi:OOP family OmpA-OmpF porin
VTGNRRLWRIQVALVPAALLLLTTACTDSDDGAACHVTDVPDHDDSTLVVEGDAWSGYAPFRDPDHLLANTGLSAIYVDQPCQAARADDLTAGRAEIALTTLDQYILHEPEGTVVGVIDQSLGADALVLTDDLNSIDDLPGLVEEYAMEDRKPVIAYTANSPSEMLLDELSNTFEELRLDDFELAPVDSSASALQMLNRDDAQLAVVWEPDTSAAVAADYTVGLSSKDVPDSIVDVIVASNDLIQRDPGAVQQLVGAYYDQMDSYLASPSHPGLTDLIVDDDPRLDVADAEKVIDGIKLYGSAEASAFLNDDEFPLDRPQIQQSIDSIGSLVALIHPGVDPDHAKFDGRYVKELLQ